MPDAGKQGPRYVSIEEYRRESAAFWSNVRRRSERDPGLAAALASLEAVIEAIVSATPATPTIVEPR